MSIDVNAVRENVVAMVTEAHKVREIAKHFLVPKEGSDESKDAQRMAMGLAATEVVVSIWNIFSSLRSPTANAAYMMITDLTIVLNTNIFWVRHADRLMPLFIAAVNAANDARELSVNAEPRWKELESQCRNLWVELLPAIVFIVGGPALLRVSSVEIKKSFLGLMNG